MPITGYKLLCSFDNESGSCNPMPYRVIAATYLTSSGSLEIHSNTSSMARTYEFIEYQNSSYNTFKVYKSHFGVLVGPTKRSGQSSDILHCGSHPEIVKNRFRTKTINIWLKSMTKSENSI
jgi:hypothetical protein